MRLSWLVSGSLLNLPRFQRVLAQETTAKDPVIRNLGSGPKYRSSLHFHVRVASVCTDLLLGALLEPPCITVSPVKSWPGLQRTSVSNLLLLGLRSEFPTESALQVEFLLFKERYSVTGEGQGEGAVIQMPLFPLFLPHSLLGWQACLPS